MSRRKTRAAARQEKNRKHTKINPEKSGKIKTLIQYQIPRPRSAAGNVRGSCLFDAMQCDVFNQWIADKMQNALLLHLTTN